MPYIINKTNGTKIAVIQDGTINSSALDITLIGKNYTGYGETFNENFVKVLEHFSNAIAPAKRITGQLWFDSGTKKIKIFDGTQFKSLGVLENSDNKPSGYNAGDLWFNKTEGRLYAYSGVGTNWILVGPLTTRSSVSGAIASTIKDDSNVDEPVVKMVVDGNDAFISAWTEFITNATDDLYTSFPKVKRGITLPNMLDNTYGVSYDTVGQSGSIVWGTASSALGLVRSNGQYVSADQYLKSSELASFGGQIVILNDDGLLVGIQSDLKLHIMNGQSNISHIGSSGNQMRFNVGTNNASSTNPDAYYNIFYITTGTVNDPKILPNSTATVYLGNIAQPFAYGYINTVTSNTIIGTAISGTTVRDAGNRVITSVTVTPSTGLSGGGTITGPSGTVTLTNTGILSIAGTANQIAVTAGQNPVLSLPQSIHTGATVNFATINATSSVNAPAIYDNLSRVVTAGTISGYAVTNLGGTANQVSVSAALGTVTISTPQNIHTGASPTFNGMTLNSLTAGSAPSSIYGAWQLASGATFQATYADLAERYAADREYEAGIVLIIGGTAEVTTTDRHGNTARAGIVSTNPAYTLNDQAGNDVTHPLIALAGRVPCRVVGPIAKGDLLVTSTKPGFAERAHANDNPNATIARALEDFEGIEGMIEVMVV